VRPRANRRGPRRSEVTLKTRSQPQAPVERPPRARRAMWIALLAIAFVAYVPSLRNGFSYDDRTVISDADYLLSHPSLAPKLLSSDYFALSGESTYRPTVTLTYMIDRTLGGGAPWVFHLDSVVWHVAAVGLVFALLLRLRAGARTAGAIALLFAVHPALTEAVDNVSFREDVLYTALGLAALLLFVRARERSSIGRCILGGAALILAQLAKESAFVFVALIPITLWCLAPPEPSRQGVRAFLRAHRAELIATAASGLCFLILRFVVFQSGHTFGSRPGGSLWTGAATGVLAIGHYLRLLFVPAPLCADYRGVIAPVTSMVDGRLWLAAAAIVAIVSLAWLARRAAPLVTWGAAIFLIGLVPVANLVPIPMPIAERFLYLPYIGGLTAVVIGVEHLRRTVGQRLPAWTLLFAVVLAACVLASLTWRRHDVWKDNETLWSTTLADHPAAYGAMHGLADVRLDQERFDEAEALLRRALASPDMDPNQRAGMLDELGATYLSEDKWEQAVPLFIESLKLGEREKPHYNLGVTLVLMGRIQEGELHLRRAIEMNPYYSKPYPMLIELARQRGDVAEAERLERRQPSPRR
jgi:hypothetical protein